MSMYPARTKRNFLIGNLQKFVEPVWVAGRIIGILDDGFVLQDESGRVDVSNEELRMKNETSSLFSVGDIAEVLLRRKIVLIEGREVNIFVAEELQILTPCTADFFIRKDDPNYLRTIVDLNLKDRLVQHARVLQKIREFFMERNFLEVDTPFLVRSPGMEPYLDVFKAEFVGLTGDREDLYLITSPEYSLKKLLVSGYEKIFQIAKSFRNKETNSSLHNPEFTLVEWYRAYASYEDIMIDTENLVHKLTKFFKGSPVVEWGLEKGKKLQIDTSTPWPRLKVKDAFREYASVEYEDFEDVERFREVVRKKGYAVDASTSYDDLFFKVFLNEIEPRLGLEKPVILYEYPVSMAALSKKCENDPKYAERFEVYIAGIELCNAFTELNDAQEQKARLEAERKERQKLGKDDYPVDHHFIRALQCGMPPSGGNALGVDRLVMLLTNTPDIRDVLFFPHRDL